jgi:hypothetical protein
VVQDAPKRPDWQPQNQKAAHGKRAGAGTQPGPPYTEHETPPSLQLDSVPGVLQRDDGGAKTW